MIRKSGCIIALVITISSVIVGCSRTYLPDLGIGGPEIPRSLRSEADALINKNRKLYGNCYASEWSVKSIAVWAYDMTGENSYLRISYLNYGEPLKSYVVAVENPSEWLWTADKDKLWASVYLNGDFSHYLDGPNSIFTTSSKLFESMPIVYAIFENELDPDWSLDSISYPFIKHTIIDERKYVFNPDICPFKSFRKYYNAVMDSVAARRMYLENKQKRVKGS